MSWAIIKVVDLERTIVSPLDKSPPEQISLKQKREELTMKYDKDMILRQQKFLRMTQEELADYISTKLDKEDEKLFLNSSFTHLKSLFYKHVSGEMFNRAVTEGAKLELPQFYDLIENPELNKGWKRYLAFEIFHQAGIVKNTSELIAKFNALVDKGLRLDGEILDAGREILKRRERGAARVALILYQSCWEWLDARDLLLIAETLETTRSNRANLLLHPKADMSLVRSLLKKNTPEIASVLGTLEWTRRDEFVRDSFLNSFVYNNFSSFWEATTDAEKGGLLEEYVRRKPEAALKVIEGHLSMVGSFISEEAWKRLLTHESRHLRLKAQTLMGEKGQGKASVLKQRPAQRIRHTL